MDFYFRLTGSPFESGVVIGLLSNSNMAISIIIICTLLRLLRKLVLAPFANSSTIGARPLAVILDNVNECNIFLF